MVSTDEGLATIDWIPDFCKRQNKAEFVELVNKAKEKSKVKFEDFISVIITDLDNNAELDPSEIDRFYCSGSSVSVKAKTISVQDGEYFAEEQKHLTKYSFDFTVMFKDTSRKCFSMTFDPIEPIIKLTIKQPEIKDRDAIKNNSKKQKSHCIIC